MGQSTTARAKTKRRRAGNKCRGTSFGGVNAVKKRTKAGQAPCLPGVKSTHPKNRETVLLFAGVGARRSGRGIRRRRSRRRVRRLIATRQQRAKRQPQ